MDANEERRDAESVAPSTAWLAPSSAAGGRVAGGGRRKPGRPLEMTAGQVLARIRELAAEARGLFRAHQAQPALYARARRLFGTWSSAVRAAGLDYDSALGAARARALRTRRTKRSRSRTAGAGSAAGPDSGNL